MNLVIGTGISLLVTIWLGYLIATRFKPQLPLFFAGVLLMLVGAMLGLGEIIPEKTKTGFIVFDAFEFIRKIFSERFAGLGLNIVLLGGFAKYMEHIKASNALVRLTIKPLLLLRSPYLVLSGTWVVGMILGLSINSASGLGMLLMVTAFPILVSLGVSRLSATAVIASSLCLDWSPNDSTTLLSASTAGLDPLVYWKSHQLPVVLCVMVVVSILHYVTQKWMDRRDGHIVQAVELTKSEQSNLADADMPWYYAVLPTLPLVFILSLNSSLITGIKMDVAKAILLSTAISMAIQYIRARDGRQICEDIQVFFNGMGVQLANVVTLIVAGEIFAKGLMTTRSVDTLISVSQALGGGAVGLIVVVAIIVAASALLMGSGNAAVFSFASLAPAIAAKLSVSPVLILLPMQFAAGTGRSVSPISAVVVVCASMGGVSPFDVVKRTAIPMAGALITLLCANFILFY